MKTLLVLLAMLVPLRAFAFCDDWRTQDTVLEAVLVAEVLYDSYITRQCIKSRPTCQEANPYLPKRPTDNDLYTADAIIFPLHLIVACLLPDAARTTWQVGSISIEYLVLKNNGVLSLGARTVF